MESGSGKMDLKEIERWTKAAGMQGQHEMFVQALKKRPDRR